MNDSSVLFSNHLLLSENEDNYILEFVGAWGESISMWDKYRDEFEKYKGIAVQKWKDDGKIKVEKVEARTLSKERFSKKDLQDTIRDMLIFHQWHGSISCNFSIADIGVKEDDINDFLGSL